MVKKVHNRCLSEEHSVNIVQLLEKADYLQTPAFVYDVNNIINKLKLLSVLRDQGIARVLYSVKALSHIALLERLSDQVDGFSASSLFEARLCHEFLSEGQGLHITSPGLRERDIGEIEDLCDVINLNSISQLERFGQSLDKTKTGLRINPEKSFVDDERYNPCRDYSKLGVPLSALQQSDDITQIFDQITGIQIHNNCQSENYNELEETLDQIREGLGEFMNKIQWLNIGGGYLFNNETQIEKLKSVISGFKNNKVLDIYFEPGKAIVGEAGYLVASVVDIFRVQDKQVAVLDTTVNHMPEVFEYQYQPDVLQQRNNSQYRYRLAGASCLSGDVFGDYYFDKKLEIGSRVIFTDVGAYMSVKANMFNGINLPSIYLLEPDQQLVIYKDYQYADFRNRL